MITTQATDTFETADFYLACFLRCSGYLLADVRKEQGRSHFVFRDQPGRREAVVAFYNGQGQVRPLSLVQVIKDMKALIHNS